MRYEAHINENYTEIRLFTDCGYMVILPDFILIDELVDNEEFMNFYNETFTDEVKTKYQQYLDSLKPSQEELDLIKAEQDKIEAKNKRELDMLKGSIYTLNEIEYKISFTKNDGDSLVQVNLAFELGLTETIISFDNGTKMPISNSEFLDFAYWFVNKRNEFFTGAK